MVAPLWDGHVRGKGKIQRKGVAPLKASLLWPCWPPDTETLPGTFSISLHLHLALELVSFHIFLVSANVNECQDQPFPSPHFVEIKSWDHLTKGNQMSNWVKIAIQMG